MTADELLVHRIHHLIAEYGTIGIVAQDKKGNKRVRLFSEFWFPLWEEIHELSPKETLTSLMKQQHKVSRMLPCYLVGQVGIGYNTYLPPMLYKMLKYDIEKQLTILQYLTYKNREWVPVELPGEQVILDKLATQEKLIYPKGKPQS